MDEALAVEHEKFPEEGLEVMVGNLGHVGADEDDGIQPGHDDPGEALVGVVDEPGVGSDLLVGDAEVDEIILNLAETCHGILLANVDGRGS